MYEKLCAVTRFETSVVPLDNEMGLRENLSFLLMQSDFLALSRARIPDFKQKILRDNYLSMH